MNFFQRIKDGAGKVSDRAQNAVEIGRLNTQIATIEREMGLYHQKMGEVFYDGYRQKDMSEAEKEMLELAKTCDLLVEERDELRARIAELKNERLCGACGKTVAEDGLYCQYCGHKLHRPKAAAPVKENPLQDEAALAARDKESWPKQKPGAKQDLESRSWLKPEQDLESSPWLKPEQEPKAKSWPKPELESRSKQELEPKSWSSLDPESGSWSSLEPESEPKLEKELEQLPADPLDFLIPSALREESAASLEAELKAQPHHPEDEETEVRTQQELEREQRRQEQLERERRRQEEMDRRIRSWQEVANASERSSEPLETAIPVVQCQVCSVELVKGTKWCPHCGSEQI